MEIWKDIKGYEDFYEVSSYGNVRNKKTNTILKGDTNSVGYRRVTLYVPVKKRFFIHRLVALTFMGEFADLVINHKDGNKTNNHLYNLEWVTRSENDLHAFKLGLRKKNLRKPVKRVELYDILTGDTVKIFQTIQEFSKYLNCAKNTISSTANGKQKSCCGFGVKYF